MNPKFLTTIVSPIIGSAERFSLEHRIFNALICSCWIMDAVAAIGNYYVGLPAITVLVASAGLVFYSLLYFFSRFRGYYRELTWPAAIGTLLLLSFLWLNNGGSAGSIHLFLVIAPLIAIFFNTNLERLLFIVLYVGVSVTLLIVEYIHPSFVHGILPRTARFADMLVSTIEVQLVIAVTIVWAVRQYKNMLARVEELRRKSEERFFEAADQMPAIISEIDLDYKITYANRMAYKLTGYTAEDLARGIFLRDIFPAEELPVLQKNLALLKSGLDLPLTEYHLVTKDEKVLTLLAKSTVNSVEGRIAGYRVYMIDVTEQKKLEDHLRQAQKMESIGQLAGGMAHDFNNILTGILGSASLIEQDLRSAGKIDKKEMHTLVEPIIISAKRAADLIKNLLVFSRFNTPTNVPFELNAVIDDAIKLLVHTIDKRIEIVRLLSESPLVVKGDRTLVESAIINLAVNSRDAMPEGGTLSFTSGTIIADVPFVQSHPDARPGVEYAMVRIEDTGKGIDDWVMQHLYEPFITTKEQGKGTGLGLASVYGTVRGHGGVIEVASDKNKGTSFTLYIPVSNEVRKPEEPAKTFPAADGKTVLIIDDEEIILKVQELSLRKQGYAVRTFTDPIAAMVFYREHADQISCVILDMVMPNINGRECYAQLHDINPGVKVIITTGYTNDDDFDEFVARNNLPVIAKPFDSTKIIETLHRILT